MDNESILFIRDQINILTEQYKSMITLSDEDDPAKTLKNSSVFNGLLLYIGSSLFNDSIKDINNNYIYKDYNNITIDLSDVKLIDYLFTLYILLASKYNQSRYTINSFCIMLNTTPKKLLDSVIGGASSEAVALLDRIKNTCEASSLASDKIVDNFILKAVYGYSDVPKQQDIDIQTVAALPDIFGKYDKLLPPDEI